MRFVRGRKNKEPNKTPFNSEEATDMAHSIKRRVLLLPVGSLVLLLEA